MPSVFFLSLMNSDRWGGSEEIWFRSAIHLSQVGCKVGVCCFNWPGKEDKLRQLSTAGCELFLLPGRNKTRSIWKKIKLKEMIRKLPLEEYEEVIINQGGWNDIVHGPLKNIYKRCKSYTIVYHNYSSEKMATSKLQLFNKWVTNAKKNIGDAARIFSAITEANHIVIPRREVMFNPITFDPPKYHTPFASSPGERLHLIVLAQLDIKRKAQDLVIRALSVEKWKARSWQLFLYGQGPDAGLIAELIATSGLNDRIFLKGYSENVPVILEWSHVLLQLTHFDAMPISVTEAMAMSRPVIASPVGDMPLWIKDNVNGWIADKVSVEVINTVLEKAWQNRHRLEAMGKESFDIFTKKYPADPVRHFLKIAGLPEMDT